MASLIDRHADQLRGTIGCFDRVLIQGSLDGLNYPGGFAGYLKQHGIRTQGYVEFVKPLSARIIENAERLAEESGLKIEFIKQKNFRKEERVAQILKERGDHPGLVHIFSAIEICKTFKLHSGNQGTAWLQKENGKCLHYYFYFVDPEMGLAFLKVSTWAPFPVQVYFNGHNWLAAQLRDRGISYELLDNAFVDIGDFTTAQRLSDGFDVKRLHKALDVLASVYAPLRDLLATTYHWSVRQLEYATDLVFKDRSALLDVFQPMIRAALFAVRAEDVARILGRTRLNPRYLGELSSDIKTRVEGARLKHRMDWASVKTYDKYGRVLRIETTTNDPSVFTHYREVVQKDGQKRFKNAKVRRTIYSLGVLQQKLGAANQRYLEFLSALELPVEGIKNLRQLSESVRCGDRPYRGINLFNEADQRIVEALARGEFAIAGFRNRDLRKQLPGTTTASISRTMKRLLLHDLLKKVPGTFKYYLTSLGRRTIVCALALKQLLLTPALGSSLDHKEVFAKLVKI